MKVAAVVSCLIGLSAAVSKRRASLYEYAFEQYENAGLEGVQARSILARDSLLPGQNTAIPTRLQSAPTAEVINETAQFYPERGAVRSKLRYGPFEMDPMNEHESMVNYLQINTQMPCKNCTITYVHASLEYPNGTYANANTSAWLHHCVMINLAHTDTVCGPNYYGHGQRWFASGNERTPASFTLDGHIPLGYHIGASDIMVMEAELMNQALFNQTVMLAITYEWIDGSPDDFFAIRPIWMDIAGCHIASDLPVKTKPDFSDETVFSYNSPTYTSDFEGAFIGMGAHLHDGGINIEIMSGQKNQLCNCVARYGETPGYIDAPGTSMTVPLQPMFNSMSHISSMSYCYAPLNMPLFQNGTTIDITANYDLNEHMPMLTLDGDFDDIMGIAIIYTAVNMTLSQVISYMGNNTLPLADNLEKTGMGGMSMMPSMGDDDDSGGDDESMSMSSMIMNGLPACVPSRDSPGTITLQNLDLDDDSTMSTLLMAIMCDTCLQVWSAPYAQYFWYGIVVVIFLFGATRIATWQSSILRKQRASHVRTDIYTYEAPAFVASISSKLVRVFRLVSYRQFGPVSLSSFFKVPSTGIILMILGYFGFVLGLQFTQASTGDLQTYQYISVRAAWLSVAQLPLIVLLSTKRNFITMVTAVTYERLNVLHRWTARGLLMTALMHFGFQWQGWRNAGVLQYELSDSCIPTGAASLALVLWMNLSTLAPFRNIAYEFFVVQHLITFFGTIIAIAYHIPTTAPYALTYVFITAALYLVSKLFQIFLFAIQRGRSRASLTPISSTVTMVTVSPSPFTNWKVGSFARLSIPKLGLVQSHPATIASTPTSHNGDLVFFLLRRRGFTHTISRAEKHTGTYKALLDGPYGGSQHDLAAYHTAVLIAGSTGVTFTLSLLLDMAQRSAHVCLPLRRLVFVWSTHGDDLVKGLRNEIATAVDAIRVAGIDIQVLIHVTRSSNVSSPFGAPGSLGNVEHDEGISEIKSGSERSNSQDEVEKMPMRSNVRALSDTSSEGATRKNSSSGIVVSGGRADLDQILSEARRTCEGEMGVAVCGPLSMTKQVRNKVAGSLQFGPQAKGAGTYLHVEGFSW